MTRFVQNWSNASPIPIVGLKIGRKILLREFDVAHENAQHCLEKIKNNRRRVHGGSRDPAARPDHPGTIAELASEMIGALESFNQQYETSLRVRIGISTGAVVAGVIGTRRLSYDLWGDTIRRWVGPPEYFQAMHEIPSGKPD